MLENIKPYYLAEQEANDKQKLLLLTPVLLTFNNDSSQNKNKKPTNQPTNSILSYSALSKKEEPLTLTKCTLVCELLSNLSLLFCSSHFSFLVFGHFWR